MSRDWLFDLLTVAVSCAVSLALYPLLIRWLRRLGFGQVIQETMGASHQAKAGTPTAGGVLFGLSDDLAKVRIAQVGIPARVKFPLQVLCAIPVAWLAQTPQHFLPPQLAWVYWPLAVLVVVGAANGVNLNDGIDGLAGGTTVLALIGVALVLPGAPAGARAVAMTLVGSLLAFLWFNRHPARIFMGDTGSLGLGAALAAIALQEGWSILLLLLGAVFVGETLSVIMQVTFFKATRGRRVFKDTPIHLTFQHEGWSENRIALTFWGVAVIALLASGWIARGLT
jgi:phospho-N-acetylmuramoyl-pentapeptide-transferase